MAEKLNNTERKEALKTLSYWSESDKGASITKIYKFETFLEAFEFMKRVAEYAEEHNHHPTWTNVYNKVTVILTTHDSGGVSAKDIALAHHMEKVAYVLFNRGTIDPSDLIF
jgi:4a-hydroxytetrahydrobiopterin dehydratase